MFLPAPSYTIQYSAVLQKSLIHATAPTLESASRFTTCLTQRGAGCMKMSPCGRWTCNLQHPFCNCSSSEKSNQHCRYNSCYKCLRSSPPGEVPLNPVLLCNPGQVVHLTVVSAPQESHQVEVAGSVIQG